MTFKLSCHGGTSVNPPRNRVARAFSLKNALLCLIVAFLSASTVGANNEAIGQNNLGLMAKACSSAYCSAGVDGLDLWISFEEVRSTTLECRESREVRWL